MGDKTGVAPQEQQSRTNMLMQMLGLVPQGAPTAIGTGIGAPAPLIKGAMNTEANVKMLTYSDLLKRLLGNPGGSTFGTNAMQGVQQSQDW